MKRIVFLAVVVLPAIFYFMAIVPIVFGQDRLVQVYNSPYLSAYFIMHDDSLFEYDVWEQGWLHARFREIPNKREKLDICFADVEQAKGSAWCVNVSSVRVKVNENLSAPAVTFTAVLPECCPDELTLSVPRRESKDSFQYEVEMAYARYMKAFFAYKYDFNWGKSRQILDSK